MAVWEEVPLSEISSIGRQPEVGGLWGKVPAGPCPGGWHTCGTVALIENYTQPKALILDPTCGAGTTCLAAANLGRRYIGIDICEAYAALAEERIRLKVDRGFDKQVG